jgi:hypothetical protein
VGQIRWDGVQLVVSLKLAAMAVFSAVSHSIWPVVATGGSGTNWTSGWPPTAMSWRRSSPSSACRPTPRWVLAIEGETEELTVGRIIDLLEPAGQHGHIRVRNLHGTRRDLILLADELARPLAGAPASGNWLTPCVSRRPACWWSSLLTEIALHSVTELVKRRLTKIRKRVDEDVDGMEVAVDGHF